MGDNQRSTKDIAETIGESEWNTRQIMKLNDLIPQLQSLVSSKRLGTTAAEQLAYLSEEDQNRQNGEIKNTNSIADYRVTSCIYQSHFTL